MSDSEITEAGFTVSRTFDATPEEVWDAWTNPEKFSLWFGTEEVDVPLDRLTMDVRPGGTLRAVMHLPDDVLIHWHGEYREVEPPTRLSYTLSDQPGGASDGDPIETDIVAVDGGTRVTIFQPRYGFSDEQIAATIEGYSGFLDSLGRVLA